MPTAFIHKLFLKTELKNKCAKSGSRHICKLKKKDIGELKMPSSSYLHLAFQNII